MHKGIYIGNNQLLSFSIEMILSEIGYLLDKKIFLIDLSDSSTHYHLKKVIQTLIYLQAKYGKISVLMIQWPRAILPAQKDLRVSLDQPVQKWIDSMIRISSSSNIDHAINVVKHLYALKALSPRQYFVAQRLAYGDSVSKIAKCIGRAEKTVYGNMEDICEIYGFRTTCHLRYFLSRKI
jgi:DNA-binding CsgD family transcriptional regulator